MKHSQVRTTEFQGSNLPTNFLNPPVEIELSACEIDLLIRDWKEINASLTDYFYTISDLIFEKVILGGGWSAKYDFLTHCNPFDGNREDGLNCILIAMDTDPWEKRGEIFMGQKVSELDLPGMVIPLRAVSMQKDRFCCSKDFAKYIDANCALAKVPIVKGKVEKPLCKRGEYYEIEVVDDNKTKIIFARNVDIATGPGVSMPLDLIDGTDVYKAEGTRIVTSEHLAELRQNSRILYGEEALENLAFDGKVLVYGNGATAAWVVEHSLACGADSVDWFVRPEGVDSLKKSLEQLGNLSRKNIFKIADDVFALSPDKLRQVVGIQDIIDSGKGLDPETIDRLIAEQCNLLGPFSPALASRNLVGKSSAFVDIRVNRRTVDISEAKIVPVMERFVQVSFSSGEQRRYTRVVIAIGQNSFAHDAAARLAGSDTFVLQRYEGQPTILASSEGSVRILGAAAYSAAAIAKIPVKEDREDIRRLVSALVKSKTGFPTKTISSIPAVEFSIRVANLACELKERKNASN
jgi:hypothetical protein